MASRLVQAGEVDAELSAITMVYDRIHPDTEAYYASLVARKLRISHHVFPCDDYLMTRLPLSGRADGRDFRLVLWKQLSAKWRRLLHYTLRRRADEILGHTPFVDTLKGLSPRAAWELIRWEWQFLGKRPSGFRAVVNPRTWM